MYCTTSRVSKIFAWILCGIFFLNNAQDTRSLMVSHQLYGTCEVSEPLLIDIIESPAFERLKHIHQYGVTYYIGACDYNFTRHEHSIGCFMIVRRFGGSVLEQAVALLHDVSHTVFSHVGDHIFADTHKTGYYSEAKDAYQDDMHCWYLQACGIGDILAHYGYSVEDVNHKTGKFLLFDRDAPKLCADRIEYNLSGGWYEHQLTKEQVLEILDALHFDDGHWYFNFTDVCAARRLADVSIFLNQKIFASDWNCFTYEMAARAIQRAVELGVITFDDVHFSIDDVVWKRLCACNDSIVQQYMYRVIQYKQSFELLLDDGHCDMFLQHKFRHIDPLVQVADKAFQRLSRIDDGFAKIVAYHASQIKRGHRIRIIS